MKEVKLLPTFEKFEHIMKECEMKENRWVLYLTAKLPERLCVSVGPLIDNKAKYKEIDLTT